MRALIVLILLSGCAGNLKDGLYTGGSREVQSLPNEVELGMDKRTVREIEGEPDRKAASRGTEYFIYNKGWGIDRYQYFVRFINGKVDSYGRVGDFDSTKDESVNINIKQR